MIDVTISIVTYNSELVICQCLESIIQNTEGLICDIIVVDNCSDDKTVAIVKDRFSSITLIENKENMGFGRAHNQAFTHSNGRYFLILNPDTIMFPEAIQKMVKFMDHNPKAGIVGCKTYWDENRVFMFPDIRIHSLKTVLFQFTPFCRLFPNSMLSRWYWSSAHQIWDATLPVEVEGITGGLIMIRSNIFKDIGGFDEGFFLFFEEHDLQRRVRKEGLKIFYLPDSEIQHYFEESCRKSKIDIGAIYLQSALYYYKKHYGLLGYYTIKILTSLLKNIKMIDSLHIQEIKPEGGKLIVHWQMQKNAERYILELSYNTSFCDRGGTYIISSPIILDANILNKLPNKTGYVRVLPVFPNNKIGKVITVFKITSNSD